MKIWMIGFENYIYLLFSLMPSVLNADITSSPHLPPEPKGILQHLHAEVHTYC